ncbi:MAG: EscU/YscU/HrcU family type III secretion system export apparatus switch protein [Planctomycetaceae bacterium]
MSDDSGERTIRPSQRRRREARQEGVVAYSRELCVAIQLLAGAGLLFLLGRSLVESLAGLLANQLQSAADSSAQDPAMPALVLAEVDRMSAWGFSSVLPWLVVIVLAAVMAGLSQAGFVLLPNRLVPQLSRLSPAGGLRRVFSGTHLAGTGLNLLRVSVLAVAAALFLSFHLGMIVSLVRLPVGQAVWMIGVLLAELSLVLAVCSGVHGVADYAHRRWRHERNLRMTPEEFRQEMRDAQPDPQFRRARQAALQSPADDNVTPLASGSPVESVR